MIHGVVRVRDGVRIHYRRLGKGPGVALLHGFPQTGHMWRKVMPALAERFDVVAPDLRGYGDSDRPTTGYDKRSMAADIAPTYDIFERLDQRSARRVWHWLFHMVPDLPEALTAGREEIYLRYLYTAWAFNPAAIEEEAIQEYLRCFRQAGAMRAAFDDYRAGGTVDLEHDAADRGKKVGVPTLVLWGGSWMTQSADMLGVWKERCERLEGFAVPDCGHFIPEEQPVVVLDAILKFVG
ncbi:MAG: alpha/beta fold hydrolase [Candidatus Rokubacteria bacterium]|nr:alpha/beta fold hydrolase [Candidatus Rokubacteria bacterium]